MSGRSVAILGAGPIGVEAALRAREDGHPVTVFEKGRVGENVRSWSHVRMFSPWSMNASPRALAVLARQGCDPLDPVEFPTGGALVERLLVPLCRSEELRDSIREKTEVVGIAREGMLKSEHIGSPTRASAPFRLLVRTSSGEEIVEHADVVIDATGTLGTPRSLGNGGLPAPGEAAARMKGFVDSTMPAPRVDDDLSHRRILVVGAGHTAATTAIALREALDGQLDTEVTWALRSDREVPFVPEEDDPLPERRKIEERANLLVAERHPHFTILRGVQVEAVKPGRDEISVLFKTPGGVTSQLSYDRCYSLVGSRPDDSLYRELQVHQCYATSGPIKLAAALLADTAGSTDCLAQTSHGVESLLNPEPDFFILGMKSYGTAPNFLLRIGLTQIEEVFDHLATKEARDAR